MILKKNEINIFKCINIHKHIYIIISINKYIFEKESLLVKDLCFISLKLRQLQ